VFSLVNTLLIRPLPYPEPNRLVRITEAYPKAAFVEFYHRSRALEVASVGPGAEFNLTGQGEAARVFGSATSANLFSVLEARMERGRAFRPGEDRPGRDGVVILSHSLWMNKFDGDPQILGRVIGIDGINREVVGVMPADFHYPSAAVQLWTPARLDPSNSDDYWGGEFAPLIGRLRPHATVAQAQGEIRAFLPYFRKRFPFPMPRDWNSDSRIIPLQDDLVADVRGKLLLLLSSVGIVLLIACANVASLLLSRATVRRKEMALRTALGAGRGRILRQLLTESVALAAIGGALGVALAETALSVFRSVLPQGLPGLSGASVDLRVLAFAASLAVLTGLAFGIAPALSASRIDLTETIKTGSQRSTSRFWTRLRTWLIAGQLALTLVLVVSAGLLIKTLYVLSQINPGFRAEQLLTIRVTPNESSCKDAAACAALYTKLVDRARGISGVSDVAIANTVPMDGRFEASAIPVDLEGHPKTADFPAPMFWEGAVSPDYLQMMHIRILEGRGLTESDGAKSSGVVPISAATARHFWPGERAVEKHIKPTWDQQWKTVVGVTTDIRQFDLANRAPNWIPGVIYVPYPQAKPMEEFR
jgi:predicted permease